MTGETEEEKKEGGRGGGMSRKNERAGEEKIRGGNKGKGRHIILQRTMCRREIGG